MENNERKPQATTRILFMGTPEFAVPSLQGLVESGSSHGWEVVAVATQPDRRAGRGKKLVESPVKQFAMKHGIPVLQPKGFRRQPDAAERLRNFAPDLFVVAAYGVILPESVLAIPTFGSINVHASILPAYRGASPITAAILDGQPETGVSIMLMDAGMDTGPVLNQVRQRIQPDDTADTLSIRLSEQGAEALVETIPRWLVGSIAPISQDDLPGEATYCRLIKKVDGQIDWQQPATQIERMTRAYAPWPSAFTMRGGQPLKIWQAKAVDGHAKPGVVVDSPYGPAVGTGEGLLLLVEIQPAGKRRLNAKSYVNGATDFIGSTLGEMRN